MKTEGIMRGFEVCTVVLMKVQVFLDVWLCRLVNSYQCFEGVYCLHRQGQAVGTILEPLYPEERGTMLL